MQSLSSLMSHSPSFNSYSSSDKLTQIAARVVQEFQFDSDSKKSDEFLLKEEGEHLLTKNTQEEHVQNEDEEEEFEFAFVCKGADLSPIPADEIFHNGQIRPVYPLFDTKLLNADQVEVQNSVSSAIPKVSPRPPPPPRLPLGKLFVEERERDSASSCSSSESDELDGVPAETYCVWAPKAAEDSRECKKSNSTGTSKRWKFRDLLHKSSSDGKDTFAFLTQKREGISEKEEASKTTGNILKPKKSAVVTAGKETAPPPHYAAKENDRRRSYLPYKKDLVGLFSNVNGMNKPVRSS